ncbi:hypothetical protein CC14983A_a0159 (plasmid) [Campylobacter coli]|uniref:hypothetical protein n=1 Tax=Campylobacter TaxID=194 RepID=UPI000856F8E0|nr:MULTISPECIES: hypothetical protein [Campylobacter]AOH51070.1 hypothetical protein CC14983A_a0159 [Campylobacter coli]EJW8985872.1 hypothetical protein [Campylobacter jejuni]EKL1525897.1 hypothetical protein [Campylobacter jejuni]ELU1694515.1 hypothetical protein [Campylobacter jejuni]UKW12716.1 hypothetical protein MA848_05040 [Campylobacter jejuni subsp. jejuni]
MAKKRTILIPRIKDINISPDTSCMHPILEDNTLVCLHGGRVKLKAKKAKRIKSDNVPIMLDNEIQGASISGCLNPPILGGPCTKVAMVFAYTYSDHKVNNKHSVLQMGLIGMSIKGYPIFAIPKKNKIKFALAKIQASPLAKIKFDRIRWEGGGGKLGAAQRRRREKSKEKAKMLLYLENENKKGKVSDKEVHLYKHNGIWPKDTPKPRSPDYIGENGEIILNIKQRAMEIKNTLNGGYNSVSIKTKDKLTRYDLDGKPHYEKTSKKIIDTPHKIEYTKHINPQDPTKYRMSQGLVEPISHKDLDIVENYLKRQNNEI